MATLFLGLLCAALFYIFYMKREIQKLTKKVAQIPESSQNGSRLYNEFHEKNLILLVSQINEMIDQYEQNNAQLKVVRDKLDYSITGLSHDLRTPLTAVKGYLELLEQTDDPQKQAQYVGAMKQSVKRLEIMANSFYEISKIELNQQATAKQSLYFYQFVQETFLNFYDQFEEAGLEVQFPESVTDERIKADSALLARVLENIIQNCLRYARNEVQIVFEKDAEYVAIRIENDRQKGQPLDDEKLFDLFYIGNQPRTNNQSSGFGLHVSKKLTEQMGGTLSASSTKEKFVITITFAK